jgi:hypothetical protein
MGEVTRNVVRKDTKTVTAMDNLVASEPGEEK